MDFVIPVDHRVKIKKKEKYLELAGELKNLRNMEVIVIPVIIGALGTFFKGLVRGLKVLEIGGQIKTIQTTALPEYREKSWRLEETCCLSDFCEKPSQLTLV